jgi:hypothetical protein
MTAGRKVIAVLEPGNDGSAHDRILVIAPNRHLPNNDSDWPIPPKTRSNSALPRANRVRVNMATALLKPRLAPANRADGLDRNEL